MKAAGERMVDTQMVMYEEDHKKILVVIGRLVREANAKGVFVVDRNGQLIAEAGEVRGIDTTSLASLVAGTIAATGGLAKIIGEQDFPVHFHQGVKDNLHITMVANKWILVVVFDERSSLGLVRLRVKKTTADMNKLFEDLKKKADAEAASGSSPFAEITDDDIDNLFND
jgi:predicted regulator of Ras-like GTPase activity (Roadblock/LC7/MglB family)